MSICRDAQRLCVTAAALIYGQKSSITSATTGGRVRGQDEVQARRIQRTLVPRRKSRRRRLRLRRTAEPVSGLQVPMHLCCASSKFHFNFNIL